MAVESLNAPGPVIASSVVNYLSSSDTIYNKALFQTAVDPELVGRYTFEDLGVRYAISQWGAEKGVDSNLLQHFEEDRTTNVIHVDAGYATGSASTTFTVDTASPNDVFEYPGSGNTIYPSATTKRGINIEVGHKLEAVVGSTRYYMWVTAISLGSPTTFTAQLIDVTSSGFATTFAAGIAGVDLFVVGHMLGEEQSPSGTTEVRLISYSNKMQRTAKEYVYSNSQMLQATAFEGQFKFNYIRGIMNTRKKFNGDCDRDFLTSRTITSTNSAFDQTNAFEGLYPYWLNYTNEVQYSTWTVEKFGEMSVQLLQNGAPNKLIGLMAPETMNDIEDVFRGSTGLENGGVIYDMNSGENRNVDFSFKHFTKAGMTYNLASFKALADIGSLGSTYSVYKTYLGLLPSGTVDGFDAQQLPVNKPAFASVYPNSLPNHTMGFREVPLDGTGGPNPVTKSPVNTLVMEQYHSFEAWCPNTYGIFTLA